MRLPPQVEGLHIRGLHLEDVLYAAFGVVLLLHADVAASHEYVAAFEHFVHLWLIHLKISAGQFICVEALECIGSALEAVEVPVLLVQFARFLLLLFSFLQLYLHTFLVKLISVAPHKLVVTILLDHRFVLRIATFTKKRGLVVVWRFVTPPRRAMHLMVLQHGSYLLLMQDSCLLVADLNVVCLIEHVFCAVE